MQLSQCCTSNDNLDSRQDRFGILRTNAKFPELAGNLLW